MKMAGVRRFARLLWKDVEHDLLDHCRRLVGIAVLIVGAIIVRFWVDCVPDLVVADVVPVKDLVAISELAGAVCFVAAELCATLHFLQTCCTPQKPKH